MIRKARLKDADQISRLIEKNQRDKKKKLSQGFLRYRRSPKKVKKIINNSLVALVYIKNNKIIGFMNAYPAKKKTKKKINWHDKKAEKLYFNSKKSAIAYLGVIHPDHHHQGIGTQLFNQMVADLRRRKYQYLFASAAIKPTPNTASIEFIKAKGFTQTAAKSNLVKTKTDLAQSAIFIKKL